MILPPLLFCRLLFAGAVAYLIAACVVYTILSLFIGGA